MNPFLPFKQAQRFRILPDTIPSVFFLIIPLFCFNTNTFSQQIIAGQTSGNSIFYFDIDDVELYAEPENTVTYHMDINGGYFDLVFGAYYSYGGYSTSYGSVAEPLGSSSISILAGEDDWIEKHYEGDTIDFTLNWYSATGILESYYYDDFGNSELSGIFDGDGYMGFKIDSPDLIIGWIRLWVNFNQMTIYDYAYYSDTSVVISENDPKMFIIKFQNPVTNEIRYFADLPELKDKYEYLILDITGRIILKGCLLKGCNAIDSRSIPSGIYFIQVTDNGKFHKSFKLLKE